MQHSKNSSENLYMSQKKLSETEHVLNAIDIWYSEVKDINWKKPHFNINAGHFSALVWKSVKEIGFGISEDKGNTFVSMTFNPKANNPKYFVTNVLPLKY